VAAAAAYVDGHDGQVDVVEQLVVVLDGHAGGEEHHHLLLAVLLEEGEEEQEALLGGTHHIALRDNEAWRAVELRSAHFDPEPLAVDSGKLHSCAGVG